MRSIDSLTSYEQSFFYEIMLFGRAFGHRDKVLQSAVFGSFAPMLYLECAERLSLRDLGKILGLPLFGLPIFIRIMSSDNIFILPYTVV